jgi:hypothetical protein
MGLETLLSFYNWDLRSIQMFQGSRENSRTIVKQTTTIFTGSIVIDVESSENSAIYFVVSCNYSSM